LLLASVLAGAAARWCCSPETANGTLGVLD
jgi:hypothetical protein